MAANDPGGASEDTNYYTEEETFSKESTDPNGIIDASKRQLVLLWATFLNFIQLSHVMIITAQELLDLPVPNELGEGATMKVRKYEWVGRRSIFDKPTAVAVKHLKFELPDTAHDLLERTQGETKHLADFSLELRALCHGALRNHANIVRLLGVTWAEKGLPALVVEKASDKFCSLDKLLEARRLRGVEKAEILAGIADGLGAIHMVSLVHGDLKPANILIFENGERGSLVPKLSDFSFSRSWKEIQSSGGTEYWNAPECYPLRSGSIGNLRSPLRDYFSLGLVFWNVFRDELPFHGIGAEGETSLEARRRIQAAKESGFLLQKLASLKESENFDAFLFRDTIPDTTDDEDAILTIVELLGYLLQPEQELREPKHVHIPSELRSRRRLNQQSTLVLDGSELTGDIWPGLEDDIRELKARMEAASLKETKIRYNLSKDIAAARKPDGVLQSVLSHHLQLTNEQILLRNSDLPLEVNSMMTASHEATLSSDTATDEQKGDAAWNLAQSFVSRQPEKAREYALKAGLFGNEHARVNYLTSCIRDSVAVALDEKTHMTWLVQSLTGPFVFTISEAYPSSKLGPKLRSAFLKGFDTADAKRGILAFTERFVKDVLGDAHPPHHQVLADGKWQTIATAKERTFKKFREGVAPISESFPLSILHITAVCGTGDVIRDLLSTHTIDLDRKCHTEYHPGEATALQVAFLSHNMETVEALVDQGADILPLFSPDTVKAFLIEGDRAHLHWLNHLIPLMAEEKNRLQARKTFNYILLSNSGLQRTIVQSNWSLFLAILELIPKSTVEEELETTLLLAVGLRRVGFVLALLVVCSDPTEIHLKKYNAVLCQTCRAKADIPMRNQTYPRRYMGLKKETLDSLRLPHDIYYQKVIIRTLLRYGIPLEVERSDSSPYAPLFLSVMTDRISLAETLLQEYQANPLFKTAESETAASIAVYSNSYKSAKLLSQLPLNMWKRLLWTRNFLGEYPIHYAAMKGNPKVIKLLLECEQPIRRKQFMNQNILHLSANIANKKGFEILFDHVQKSSPAQLQELLNEKDKVGATPLHLFLGSNAEDGTTSKSEASQDRNLCRLLHKILPLIPDLNATDDSDLTPLHHLLLFNGDMSDSFTLLLDRGANPWKHSRIGAMPLQVARQAGRNCALATILALAPDPGRDVAVLTRVLETINGFGAVDGAVVKRRLEERRNRCEEIETQAREECSRRAGLAHG